MPDIAALLNDVADLVFPSEKYVDNDTDYIKALSALDRIATALRERKAT